MGNWQGPEGGEFQQRGEGLGAEQRTVADNFFSQGGKAGLETQSQDSSEGCSDPKIELHSSADSLSLQHIEIDRIPGGVINLTEFS